jgi:phage-related protein
MKFKDEIGYALHLAQCGNKHTNTKPYKGLPGVIEIVSDFDKETYRALFAYKIGNNIYVLHVFHKKSTSGKNIPKGITEVIKQRFKEAVNHAKR